LNQATSALLQACAFLSPNAIPEEIITEGAPELGPVLNSLISNPNIFIDMVEVLRRYSLTERNSEIKTLIMHPLVQVALKDEMDDNLQHTWAERLVRAVNHIYPDVGIETRQQCQRYLNQAQVCATLIEQYELAFPEASQLLNHLGTYLKTLSHYERAISLYQYALRIDDRVLPVLCGRGSS
jgi:hypothetical protein